MRARIVGARLLLLFLIAFPALGAQGAGSKSESSGLVSLRILPQDVTLFGSQASQHFLVFAQNADALERDVTSQAHFSLSENDKGVIDGSGKFVGRNSGKVVLTATVGGRSAKATIRLEDTEKPRPFTFARDIGGILTQRGCNDTSCHGSVKGRGAFKLSVYTQSPREDYK